MKQGDECVSEASRTRPEFCHRDSTHKSSEKMSTEESGFQGVRRAHHRTLLNWVKLVDSNCTDEADAMLTVPERHVPCFARHDDLMDESDLCIRRPDLRKDPGIAGLSFPEGS
jgi:hypothetical protein